VTTDLWMLVATALLALTLPFVYSTGRVLRPGGLFWSLGNREQPLEVSPWMARAFRAHQNLVENIGPFAVLVLVAHVTSMANALTALGSVIFFWSRLTHALLYTAGIGYLRTFAFGAGLAGEFVILLQLCR
jgi:uncharacterized MAPEG superfamily protein